VEALNKWDGGRAGRGEVGLLPPQFWGPGVLPREIFEDIGSNLCNLELKISILNRIQTFTSYQ